MAETTAEVIATPGAALPFRVVFKIGSRVIAETGVTSELSGQELIAAVLPTLQKYDKD